MAIGELCNREVVVVAATDTVSEAARLMREHHVGTLVVVREHDGRREPVGLVTDRDLVMEALAPGVDPALLTVGDIMLPELVKVHENTGVFEAIRYMRDKGVRRLPVVDAQNGLVGLLAQDDLLEMLAEELTELSRLVRNEQAREARNRR